MDGILFLWAPLRSSLSYPLIHSKEFKDLCSTGQTVGEKLPRHANDLQIFSCNTLFFELCILLGLYLSWRP